MCSTFFFTLNINFCHETTTHSVTKILESLPAFRGGVFVVFLMFIASAFLGQSCHKLDDSANHAPSLSNANSSQRDNSEWLATYYLNGDVISPGEYASLDSTWYFHDVVKESSESSETPVLLMERQAFSSRSAYESWGSLNDIQVSKMLDYEERLRFVADSAGISANDTIPTWYSAYASALYEDKFGDPADFQYLGSRFFTNSCVPGSPGCSNASFFFPAFVTSAPTWGHFNPLAWIFEDNAEAWEPERLSQGGSWSITLRPYPNAFFIKLPWQNWKPRTTTVRLGPGTRKLFVPFTGPLSMWSNRISSWILFPDA